MTRNLKTGINHVKAVRFIRWMRGSSQPCLIGCDDGLHYVVKMQGTPQGPNVLANEWIATAMARAIKLPVPDRAMVEITQSFLDQNPGLSFRVSNESYPPPAGVHFGSCFIRSTSNSGRIFDYAAQSQSRRTKDECFYVGMSLFDIATEADGARRPVFTRATADSHLTTAFVGFGGQFRGPAWAERAPQANIHDSPFSLLPLFRGSQRLIDRWLVLFEQHLPKSLVASAGEVPPEWHQDSLEQMTTHYLERLSTFTSSVHDCLPSDGNFNAQPLPFGERQVSS